MAKKKRVEIPSEIAARVLFLSNRTCCVCRIGGKPVQIHHINEDPSNYSVGNLAVLCFECHRDTQIRGGFDRELDADQVVLYRDDWHRLVAQQRALYELTEDSVKQNDHQKIELATSTVESYRENQEFGLLAMYYNSIGNYELRDKYVEIAIQEDPSDQNTCYLRGLQGKPELITEDVIERELARYTENKDWTQRARFFTKLGKHREAAADYLQGILESLNEDNIFSAAYYLKEVEKEDLVQELFILALRACANRERIRR